MRHLAMALLLALAAGAALAKDPSATQELDHISADLSATDKQITTLNDELADIPPLRQGRAKELADLKAEHDKIKTDFLKEREPYVQACVGKELFGQDYLHCKTMMETLQKSKNEKTPLAKKLGTQIQTLEAQQQEAVNQLQLKKTKVLKLQQYRGELQASFNAIKKDLNGQCRNAPADASIEYLKLHCGNIQFDGSRFNLPPCVTDKCLMYEGKIPLPSTPQGSTAITPNSAPQELHAGDFKPTVKLTRPLDQTDVPLPGAK